MRVGAPLEVALVRRIGGRTSLRKWQRRALVSDLKSKRGKVSENLDGVCGDHIISGSNTSPSRKAAGNDSGVLRKSSWP